MKIEIRNKRIAELYKTNDYSLRKLAKIYKISPTRIKDVLVKELTIEGFKEVKRIRSLRVAERMKESYINIFVK